MITKKSRIGIPRDLWSVSTLSPPRQTYDKDMHQAILAGVAYLLDLFSLHLANNLVAFEQGNSKHFAHKEYDV